MKHAKRANYEEGKVSTLNIELIRELPCGTSTARCRSWNFRIHATDAGSAAKVALAARRDGDQEVATGAYIPSFSAKERSNSAGKEAWALGEAREVFGVGESADEPITSSPEGMGCRSADRRLPSFVQSRRNQTVKPPESTDGLMYPAYGLMETSERCESCESESCGPLVVTELNAVEEQSSSVSKDSEATIPAVPAMHAMARVGICPNFSPGDPFIIMEKSKENSGEKYPVKSSTVAGEPVC